MNVQRQDIIDQIVAERLRQLNSPNSSTDFVKTKSDWTSTIGYYLFETSSKAEKHCTFEEFRESLIKAAAVILSALEHSYAHDEKVQELLNKLQENDSDAKSQQN